MSKSLCHPNRPGAAHGLCSSCYCIAKRYGRTMTGIAIPNLRPSPCHPDKPLYARGMCWNCYRSVTQSGRRHHLRKKYDITLEEFNQQAIQQNWVCAICGGPPIARRKDMRSVSLSVDHNHLTNKPRGLLCDPCNRRIHPGDTAAFFDAVAAYLRKYE